MGIPLNISLYYAIHPNNIFLSLILFIFKVINVEIAVVIIACIEYVFIISNILSISSTEINSFNIYYHYNFLIEFVKLIIIIQILLDDIAFSNGEDAIKNAAKEYVCNLYNIDKSEYTIKCSNIKEGAHSCKPRGQYISNFHVTISLL